MGLGGTWIYPTGLKYDVCPCSNSGNECCANGGDCSCAGDEMESIEGSPGFWENQLPTTVPKWRIGDSVGCYTHFTGSPLFQFGQYGGHDCDYMGLAQVS